MLAFCFLLTASVLSQALLLSSSQVVLNSGAYRHIRAVLQRCRYCSAVTSWVFMVTCYLSPLHSFLFRIC